MSFMNTNEKVAYLKGLLEGLDLNPERPETKLFRVTSEILEELSAKLSALDEDLELYTECLYDRQPTALEAETGEEPFSEEEPEECEDGEGNWYEIECPTCGKTVCIDDGILEEGGIDCPNCGEKLEFESEAEDG